jgi:hypothetical protein
MTVASRLTPLIPLKEQMLIYYRNGNLTLAHEGDSMMETVYMTAMFRVLVVANGCQQSSRPGDFEKVK